MSGDSSSKRAEALHLADELLRNIELREISAPDVALKASRLARLLGDADALGWLRYEVAGYPTPLDGPSEAASRRSNRHAPDNKIYTGSVGALQAEADAATAQLGPAPAGSGGQWEGAVENDRRNERATLRIIVSNRRETVDRVVGAIHAYVSEKYQELRFGSAVESAFEVVRVRVDADIGGLIPDALPMLAAAFENAASDNPEHWANAAGTCRRLLREAADVLRPPGDPIPGGPKGEIQMGPDNYINRLVAWINEQATSAKTAAMIQRDLEFLGARLDAADGAGQKGAHASVTREEASRYITGTYLVLGDILGLRDAP